MLIVNFFDIDPIKAKYTKNKNIFEKEVPKNFSLEANQNKYLTTKKNDNFKEAILKDFNNSNYKIAELIQDKKDSLSELNIISDIQYFEGDKFFASGNVVLSSTEIKLSGDKVVFDKEKKDFSIEGNVKLYYGSQYFEASKIVYNLNSGNGYIDNIYDTALRSGALGGKLLGAGSGGFMLFYVPKKSQIKVIQSLKKLLYIPFNFENKGSQIIYNSNRLLLNWYM